MLAGIPVQLITELCDLLFYPFIKCAVDGDYSGLVKAGNPTDEELASAWRQLFTKFLELSGSKDAKNHGVSVSKMENIHSKILRVEVTVAAILDLKRIDMLDKCGPLFDSLREYGYSDKKFTPESIDNDLESVVKQLQNDRLKLKTMMNDYQFKQEKNGQQGVTTRESYLKALHTIEDVKGRGIDRNTLTAEDFALYLADVQKQSTITPKNQRHAQR
jgi:predicted ribosome quality control (RQC) complex YloA/Tae2 family protein